MYICSRPLSPSSNVFSSKTNLLHLLIGRLCIAAADRDRLLDESNWPESILISEWYHVNPADRAQRAEEPTITTDNLPLSATAHSSGANDNTVIYNAGDSAANAEAMDLLTTVDHGV